MRTTKLQVRQRAAPGRCAGERWRGLSECFALRNARRHQHLDRCRSQPSDQAGALRRLLGSMAADPVPVWRDGVLQRLAPCADGDVAGRCLECSHRPAACRDGAPKLHRQEPHGQPSPAQFEPARAGTQGGGNRKFAPQPTSQPALPHQSIQFMQACRSDTNKPLVARSSLFWAVCGVANPRDSWAPTLARTCSASPLRV